MGGEWTAGFWDVKEEVPIIFDSRTGLGGKIDRRACY